VHVLPTIEQILLFAALRRPETLKKEKERERERERKKKIKVKLSWIKDKGVRDCPRL